METKFGTNQAVWSWELSDGNENFPRKIIFRNSLCEDDFVYDDPDRMYETYTEYKDDHSNVSEVLTDFIEYAANKLSMTSGDKELLNYMLRAYNWKDIRYCIYILDNDVSKEFHEFLIKYNFKIYLNPELTLS